jgi:hypothetical protein
MFVIAYPHFDPREMIAVEELWRAAARDNGRPIIVFNAELDRIRSGGWNSMGCVRVCAREGRHGGVGSFLLFTCHTLFF